MMDVELSAAITKISDMINAFIEAIPSLVIAIILFVIFFLVARWVKGLVEHFSTKYGLAPHASLLLGRLTRWLIISFGLLVGLSVVIPSFELGQLIQLLGIGGIAVGFAFRDIAQNFLAGILILLTQPFRIGDQIIVNEYEGTVEEIQTRATVIKTYDGRRVVIPNSDLFTDSVTVNTAFNKRRSHYDIGVSYEADIEQARTAILDVLGNIQGVLQVPAPDVLTVELDSSSVNLQARWWTDPQQSEVATVRDSVISGIKKKLDEQGINIPFPIRTIYFHNETVKQNGNNSPQHQEEYVTRRLT